ncbi:MAG: hypothetical protein AB7U20_01975 [Planctomycetaceae bacterium]
MDEGLQAVLGMSIAYLASGLGMLFAYLGYRKRHLPTPSDRSREEQRHG